MTRTIFFLLLTQVSCSSALTWNTETVKPVITWHQIDATKFELKADEDTLIIVVNTKQDPVYRIEGAKSKDFLDKIYKTQNRNEPKMDVVTLVNGLMGHIINGKNDELCIENLCIIVNEDISYYKKAILKVWDKEVSPENGNSLDRKNWIYSNYGQMITYAFLILILIIMAHVITLPGRNPSDEIITRISDLEKSFVKILKNETLSQKVSELESSFSRQLGAIRLVLKNDDLKTLLTGRLDLQNQDLKVLGKTVRTMSEELVKAFTLLEKLARNDPSILGGNPIPLEESGQLTYAQSDFSNDSNSSKISDWVDKNHKEKTGLFENFIESYRKGALLFKKEDISQLSSKEHQKIYSALYFLKEWQDGEQVRNPQLVKELGHIQDLIKSRLATLRKQDICSGVFPTADSYDPHPQQEEIKTRYKECRQALLEKSKKIEQEQFGSMQSIVFEEWSTIFIGKIAECLDSFLMNPDSYKRASRLLSIFGYDFIPVSIGEEYKSRIQQVVGYEKSAYPDGRVTRIERHGLETNTGDLYKKACVILSKTESGMS